MRWFLVRKSLKKILKMEKGTNIKKFKQKKTIINVQFEDTNYLNTTTDFYIDSPLFNSSCDNKKSKKKPRKNKIQGLFTPQQQKGT